MVEPFKTIMRLTCLLESSLKSDICLLKHGGVCHIKLSPDYPRQGYLETTLFACEQFQE